MSNSAATSPTEAQQHRRRESIASRFTAVVQKASLSVATASNAIRSSSTPNTPVVEQHKFPYPSDINLTMNPEDYELQKIIGYGSSAVVHSAIYKPLKMRVAIKIIDLDMFERHQIEELRRELQIMTLSRHKNILPVYGAFVSGHKLYIVTPYLSAGSCLHLMKTAYPHGIEEQAIAVLLKECLQGLDYLHKNGHIHRDVKAGNLLVDADGTVMLADFGVSSSLTEHGERKGQRRTFVGTPCWMAPEVLTPEKGYDQKADIWSFGITALELANGQAPYARFPPLKVLMLTMSHDPPSLNRDQTKHKYSKAFAQLIDACLQKDPRKRPTAEKLLESPFFKNIKKKEYLQKTLLKDLPEVSEREVKKPDVNKVSFERGVSWDFSGVSTDSIDFLDSKSPEEHLPFSSDKRELVAIKETEEKEEPPKEEPKKKEREIRRGRFSVNLRPEEAAEIAQAAPAAVTSAPNTLSRRGRFDVTSWQEEQAPPSPPQNAKIRAETSGHARLASTSSLASHKSSESTASAAESVLSRTRATSETLKKTLMRNEERIVLDKAQLEDIIRSYESLELLTTKLVEENEAIRRRSTDEK